jgi:squalene-hopene/tetraprenyl-beta-curcumene cyclase
VDSGRAIQGSPSVYGRRTAQWIADRQYKSPHLYTNAAPGGWAWTHLAGGVPDVDDTSGAILALKALGSEDGIADGVRWLLKLQNSDGGWPTFCRGLGRLPFDRSAPDLTAHALRAICCMARLAGDRVSQRAIRYGLQYLGRSQEADGSWMPLWFGNQAASGQTNPVVGTARVLRALEILDHDGPQAARGVEYLLRSQNADGGWGGATAVASSIEETALAVAALTGWSRRLSIRTASLRGAEYLMRGITRWADQPVPIGLYFAHLWYSEQLYPLIWTLDALGRFIGMTQPLSGDPAGEGRLRAV